MSDMKLIHAEDTGYDVVPAKTHHLGEEIIEGCAGAVSETITILCHECFFPTEQEYRIIHSGEEWNYPGVQCEDCNRYLDIVVRVYRNGPGRDIYEEVEDIQTATD